MEVTTQIESLDGTPILRGVLCRPGQIKVFCPECEDYHLHGWPPGTPDDATEHRVAHCHNRESRYRKGGYYVALQGSNDPEREYAF